MAICKGALEEFYIVAFSNDLVRPSDIDGFVQSAVQVCSKSNVMPSHIEILTGQDLARAATQAAMKTQKQAAIGIMKGTASIAKTVAITGIKAGLRN